jgi:hypothetical protein
MIDLRIKTKGDVVEFTGNSSSRIKRFDTYEDYYLIEVRK